MTAQQPLTIMPRVMPLRTKLQLGFVAACVGGGLVQLGSQAAWAVWSRVDPPVMLFDPRQDLCRAVGEWGLVLMAVGACGLAFVAGDASLRSRLSRYGVALFWGCAAGLLFLSKTSAYARLSIAELYQTLLGRGLIAGVVLGLAAILASLALGLVARIAKARGG